MRVGGARPPPFITFTLTSKVAVYAPAEWADTLTLFHLYQYMYSVGPALVFDSTTVDLFGPINFVNPNNERKTGKVWGAIFV